MIPVKPGGTHVWDDITKLTAHNTSFETEDFPVVTLSAMLLLHSFPAGLVLTSAVIFVGGVLGTWGRMKAAMAQCRSFCFNLAPSRHQPWPWVTLRLRLFVLYPPLFSSEWLKGVNGVLIWKLWSPQSMCIAIGSLWFIELQSYTSDKGAGHCGQLPSLLWTGPGDWLTGDLWKLPSYVIFLTNFHQRSYFCIFALRVEKETALMYTRVLKVNSIF